uniref:G-protein coupled receptors family 1 profile domain-containing protein n=1 Tax=Denticeps clupeoides TaxID=299321 RepID=A0AAY4ADJ2_9TELE
SSSPLQHCFLQSIILSLFNPLTPLTSSSLTLKTLTGQISESVFSFLVLKNTGYILLCQHCICITGFNAAATVMHSIRALHVPTVRLACWLLFDVQVVFARGLMVTLTLMSLKTCVSVCWPLRSPDLIHRSRHFIVFTAWLLVFFNPVVFTVLSCINTPWQKLKAQETPCSTALEGSAPRISGLAQLGVLMILIVASYVLIYLEGYRAGHFSQANSKGQRTILIHGLQMGLHVLPSLIIILRLRKSLAVEITNLIVFCVAQSASPIVYGLRCRDIWIQLPQFIRCNSDLVP